MYTNKDLYNDSLESLAAHGATCSHWIDFFYL